MQSYKISLLLLMSAWLTACSSLSVSYDYNEQVDFSHYQSYDWLPSLNKKDIDELNRIRFITAVDDHLHAKGFTKKQPGADLQIAAHFGKKSKIDITNWGYNYTPNIYYSRYHRHYDNRTAYSATHVSASTISVHEYEQGTLILDFIDNKTRQLVWRATATAIINPASTPEKQTEKIKNAVEKILEHFPPDKQ